MSLAKHILPQSPGLLVFQKVEEEHVKTELATGINADQHLPEQLHHFSDIGLGLDTHKREQEECRLGNSVEVSGERHFWSGADAERGQRLQFRS